MIAQACKIHIVRIAIKLERLTLHPLKSHLRHFQSSGSRRVQKRASLEARCRFPDDFLAGTAWFLKSNRGELERLMLLDQVVVELQVIFFGEQHWGVLLHVGGGLVQAKICGSYLGFEEFVCEHLFVFIPFVQTIIMVVLGAEAIIARIGAYWWSIKLLHRGVPA